MPRSKACVVSASRQSLVQQIVTLKRLELLFSLDTTGSMYSLLVALRRRLGDMIRQLKQRYPNLHVGFIAHGDDAAYNEHYSTKSIDLTGDVDSVIEFIQTCGDTKGGGPHANYEVVLKEARTFSWSADATKALIIVGDEVPHTVGQHLASRRPNQRNEIDYKNELRLLQRDLKIPVYGIHCLPGIRRGSENFYRNDLAGSTGGSYMTIDQLDLIPDLIELLCRRTADIAEGGTGQVDEFEAELTGRVGGKLDRNRRNWFQTIRTPGGTAKVDAGDLEMVPGGKYQPYEIFQADDVQDFCANHGLAFEAGRLFQRVDKFRKTCDVQGNKIIVLKHRVTGDLFSGAAARKRLGLPDGQPAELKYISDGVYKVRIGGTSGTWDPAPSNEYEVFVQSKSHNRELKVGQEVLYDVDGIN